MPSMNTNSDNHLGPLLDAEERAVLFAALDSFKKFRSAAHSHVTHRRRQNFYALPTSQWQMLAEPPFCLLQNLGDVDDAIDCNADIADAILESGLKSLELPREPAFEHPQSWHGCAKASDVNKAHSTIRQLYRDWSSEGAQERKQCYDFVLGHLEAFSQNCPTSNEQTSRPKILVPGAGLGRLVYEICRAGYDVEGNEISYHQLLASNWVLNYVGANAKQQLRKVMIPDVHPSEGIKQASANGNNFGDMTMTAADFVILYSEKEYSSRFDAVATMFFIDTAPNFIRYTDTLRNCLKVNGTWINVGPLLWHSDVGYGATSEDAQEREASSGEPGRDAGIGEPGSFEATEEEVIWLLEKKGFQVEHREVSSDGVGYLQDPDSMFQNMYRLSSWVARKTD